MASVSSAPRHLGRQWLRLICRGGHNLRLLGCRGLRLLHRDGHGLNLGPFQMVETEEGWLIPLDSSWQRGCVAEDDCVVVLFPLSN